TLTNHHGRHFRLDQARLFDRADRAPAVVVAAGGPEAARLAGRKADGLIATEARPDLVQAYRSAGGAGPRYAEVGMCYARTEEEAKRTAHRYHRWGVLGWPVMAELPNTESFAAAAEFVSPDTVAQY